MPSEASPPRETGAPVASSPRGQGAPSEASSPATEELRRHPSSILFGIGALARRLILPWLFAFVVSGGRRSADVWFLLLVVPAAVIAVLEYVFVRYALGP